MFITFSIHIYEGQQHFSLDIEKYFILYINDFVHIGYVRNLFGKHIYKQRLKNIFFHFSFSWSEESFNIKSY